MNIPGDYRSNGFNLRGDHAFNAAQKLCARYTHKDVPAESVPQRQRRLQHAGRRPIRGQMTFKFCRLVQLDHFSALINGVRAGYSISDFDNTYPLAADGKQIIAELGITNLPPVLPRWTSLFWIQQWKHSQFRAVPV